MRYTIKKVLIAAGGRGTRFLPITSTIPKEMLPIIDKPIFQYVLEEVVIPGIEEVILVINKRKKTLLDYLKSNSSPELAKILKKVKIKVVYQKGSLYGDAVPVIVAKKHLEDGPFLVVWADSFSLPKYLRIKGMINSYKKYKVPIISLIPITKSQTYLYAVPAIENKIKDVVIIKRLLEKPGSKLAPSLLAAPNGYILEPTIFRYLKNLKLHTTRKELILVDAIDAYCQENDMYGMVFKKPFFEAGNRADYVKTTLSIARDRPDLKKIVKSKLS